MKRRYGVVCGLLAVSLIANLLLGIALYRSRTDTKHQEAVRVCFLTQKGAADSILRQMELLKTIDATDTTAFHNACHQVFMDMETLHQQWGREEQLRSEEGTEPPATDDRWLLAHSTRNALLSTDTALFPQTIVQLYDQWERLCRQYAAVPDQPMTLQTAYQLLSAG